MIWCGRAASGHVSSAEPRLRAAPERARTPAQRGMRPPSSDVHRRPLVFRCLATPALAGARAGTTDLADRERNALLRLLPRKQADFGVRRQHRGLHGDRVGMRRDIVGQDQHRRLAIAHEIARHREDEIGLVRYILVRNSSTMSIVMSGRALDQLRTPALHVVVVEQVARLRAQAARLRQHRRDDAVRRALQQVPDEGAADAEAHAP